MSEEEVRRAQALGRVTAGEMTQVEAAEWLQLSYRQVKRLYARYQHSGAAGLAHGNAGKRSHHGKEEGFRRQVLQLVRAHYSGDPGARFGPTLAAEHLAEDHGLELNAETLRRWMLSEGLWSRERKRQPYRRRRARKEHFGELLQMDGSFEEWLEQRGPRGCLINVVDDATGVCLARLEAEETTWAVADALRAWVESYGIPRALYADWKNVYQHQPTERQKREGEEVISQFGRMCAKLGIQLIAANSPQAKGRVERSHGTHQDRLIKKMRLRQIGSYAQANEYLRQVYLPQHNRKYSVEPHSEVDFHEAAPRNMPLDEVFSLEEDRRVGNDWVVRYRNHLFQIDRGEHRRVKAGSKVLVRQHRDGRIELVSRGAAIAYEELESAPDKPAVPAPLKRRAGTRQPAADHPWRRSFQAASV